MSGIQSSPGTLQPGERFSSSSSDFASFMHYKQNHPVRNDFMDPKDSLAGRKAYKLALTAIFERSEVRQVAFLLGPQCWSEPSRLCIANLDSILYKIVSSSIQYPVHCRQSQLTISPLETDKSFGATLMWTGLWIYRFTKQSTAGLLVSATGTILHTTD